MEVSQANGVRERVMDDKECPFADMHNLRRVRIVSRFVPFNSCLYLQCITIHEKAPLLARVLCILLVMIVSNQNSIPIASLISPASRLYRFSLSQRSTRL